MANRSEQVSGEERRLLLLSDNKSFKASLTIKSKAELELILGNVANALDSDGKGYVNQFEDYLRDIIGYRKSKAFE